MTLSRPAWLGKKSPMPSLTTQLEAAMLKGKRVLFLDDDLSLAELVGRAARDYDLQLVPAPTSGVARDLIENHGPFDAAILDVAVANGDGISLYQWIKTQCPRMQVIFLTGAPVDLVSDKIHAVGSAPVYGKPTLLQPAFVQDLFEKLGCRRRALI